MATGRPVGRPSRPTEVKRMLGNPGQRPLPDAPMPGEGLPAVSGVPDSPGFGEHGSEMWERVWLAGRSWLSPTVDYPLVTMLCQAADEAEEIRRLLDSGEEDRYYVVGNGQKVTSPLVSQLKDLRAQITAWLAALGYSPSDRARLGLGEVRQGDALDDLQRRRMERRADTA